MFSIRSLYTAAAICMALFSLQVSADDNANNQLYCSSINTAGTNANSSIYQSNGLCSGFCSEYAFAVVQYNNCWCSNYIPATTVSTSKCATVCPGYKELCGGDNLFGYLALANVPAGTKGASVSSSTVPTTAASSTTKPLVTTSSSVTSSSSTLTWTPTPVLSVETVTGQVRTVTYTPTSPPSSQSNTASTSDTSSSSGSGGLSTGGAVGLTIGLVALVAIVAAVGFCCFRRKRKAAAATAAVVYEESQRGSSAGIPAVPQRTMSESSRFMLGTNGRQVVEGWNGDEEASGSSRRSRLMPVDPRLDPFAPVYQNGNKSRESVATMRDDHDYSRRVATQGPILRATNPD